MSIPISEDHAATGREAPTAVETLTARLYRLPRFSGHLPAWLQAAPFAAIFVIFFLVPLALTVVVSFWDYNEYQLLPAFTLRSYVEIFEGCVDRLPDLCVTFKTYLSTLKFCAAVWLVTLIIGFFIAYFLAFQVRSVTVQIALFLVCTIPFWTSNVIRTIS
jgi:putative spermidine/putrescine transport system permease protein